MFKYKTVIYYCNVNCNVFTVFLLNLCSLGKHKIIVFPQKKKNIYNPLYGSVYSKSNILMFKLILLLLLYITTNAYGSNLGLNYFISLKTCEFISVQMFHCVFLHLLPSLSAKSLVLESLTKVSNTKDNELPSSPQITVCN